MSPQNSENRLKKAEYTCRQLKQLLINKDEEISEARTSSCLNGFFIGVTTMAIGVMGFAVNNFYN